MFNGKSFNEKYLLTRKHYDFTRAINCTCKLTCVCAYVYVCNHTRLREQYELLFFILGYFCPFTAWTIKISKKWKKTPGDVNILRKCTKNDDHYTVPEIWHMTDVIYFSFWAIFCPFTLNSQKNQNFKKMKKNAWRYYHLIHKYQELWLHDARFLRYGAIQTDGQMEGWKKSHIEVDAPPKKTRTKVKIKGIKI